MNVAIARGVMRGWEAEQKSGLRASVPLKLEGYAFGDLIVSFLSQRPGSTTADVQAAIRTKYSPTIQLGRLRASGRVRVEYFREAGRNNRTARWWLVDGR